GMVPCFFGLLTPPASVLDSLPLHDALPSLPRLRPSLLGRRSWCRGVGLVGGFLCLLRRRWLRGNRPTNPQPRHHDRRPKRQRNPDRKSTRLNSSHVSISYAGFCLKQKQRSA